MSVTERLDAFQQRHPWAGFPLAVIYKFVDDQGSYLAALITHYAFLSLFPLLLLASSILGFLLRGNEHLQQQLIDSALSQFPIIGDQLQQPEGLGGGPFAVTLGIVGSLYGGLGVAQAMQNATNIAWAVPKNRRPNPLKSRLRSLLLLGVGGIAVIGTTILSALGSSSEAFGASLGPALKALLTLAAMVLNALVFVLAFRVSTVRKLNFRDAAPGAIIAAVLWQLLQSFGTAFVGHVVKNASATNGVFALVLGLLAWIYLAALAVVLCVEINVVRTNQLYPRALLTPFTDNVDLTPADEEAYAELARAQRSKGFESVDVSFDKEQQSAPKGDGKGG